MPRRYRHLTFEERCQVEIPKKSGLSRGSIAQHPALILRSDCTLTGMRQGVALQIGIGAFKKIRLNIEWSGRGLPVNALPTKPGIYAEIYRPERGVRIGETGRSIRGKIKHDIRWFRSMGDGTAPKAQLRRTLPIAEAAKKTGDVGFAYFVVSCDNRLEDKELRQACERQLFEWVRQQPNWADWNRQRSWR